MKQVPPAPNQNARKIGQTTYFTNRFFVGKYQLDSLIQGLILAQKPDQNAPQKSKSEL
ncbi:MAG: hypothetical protein Q4A21_02845 [bacterium]|nr:hypothetical protein [bacterium]